MEATYQTGKMRPASNPTGSMAVPQTGQTGNAPPAVDLSFLANYPPEQIAAIGQLFLSGAMQLPSAALPSLKTPQPNATPVSDVPVVSDRNDISTNDLEDGEISDISEPYETRPAEPPAAVPKPVQQTNGKRRRSMSPQNGVQQRHLSSAYYTKQEQQLESFIRIMYDNGYGFDQVKRHVSNQEELTALYQRLSLPTITQSTKAPPEPRIQHPQTQTTLPDAKPTTKPTSTSPVVQDRQSYLARLQAAKNKKTEVVHTQASAQRSETTATAPSAARKGLAPEKRELLLQRLAAIKTSQASKSEAEALTALTSSNDVDSFLNSVSPAITSVPGVATTHHDVIDTANHMTVVPREPFDTDASRTQSLVISVSSDEQSESEIDEESMYNDDGGVQIQPVDAAIVNGSTPAYSAFVSVPSGGSTPGQQTYEQKMHDLAVYRQRIADLEQRKHSKLNEQGQAETGSSVVPNEQMNVVVTATEEPPTRPSPTGLGSLPGLIASDAPYDRTFSAIEAAEDGDADVDDASDSSDFAELYQEPADNTTHADLHQNSNQAAVEEDSDWTGTASDSDIIEPSAENQTQEPQASSFQHSGHPFHQSSASDACSMDMSDSSGSDEMDMGNTDDDDDDDSIVDATAAERYMADTSPGLQQTEHVQPADQSDERAANTQAQARVIGRYRPYDSPLKVLTRYRFHPHLAQQVKAAWRSPTWTHKNDPMEYLSPANTKCTCRNHDEQCHHIHWEDYVPVGVEYLVDLAWNPGWDEQERQEWAIAMEAAAQEQLQHKQAEGTKLHKLCERIIAKHAQAWAKQALVRNVHHLS